MKKEMLSWRFELGHEGESHRCLPLRQHLFYKRILPINIYIVIIIIMMMIIIFNNNNNNNNNIIIINSTN